MHRKTFCGSALPADPLIGSGTGLTLGGMIRAQRSLDGIQSQHYACSFNAETVEVRFKLPSPARRRALACCRRHGQTLA